MDLNLPCIVSIVGDIFHSLTKKLEQTGLNFELGNFPNLSAGLRQKWETSCLYRTDHG